VEVDFIELDVIAEDDKVDFTELVVWTEDVDVALADENSNIGLTELDENTNVLCSEEGADFCWNELDV
jgi:hypothetical protein